MEKYQYRDLFLENSIDKQLSIDYGETSPITNVDIYSESMEIKESLCSGDVLKFGTCEASSFKIRIANLFLPLKGRKIAVSTTLGGHIDAPFQYGIYKVDSDKPTADRRYRDIVAYDAMYDILNADVTEWYNTILPNKDSTVTLKAFRDSFMAEMGVEQEEISLANDNMIVEKTIEPNELSGKRVIEAICEINGCFGHIGRNGKFQYVFLKELIRGLYPSDTLYPSDDLFPTEEPEYITKISKTQYKSCKYEDFETAKIGQLQIRQEENDVGVTVGSGNGYVVEDNFLLYGKDTKELSDIANKMLGVIKSVAYRPCTISAVGNPSITVGDGVLLSTKYALIYTYVLQRTLKGIQALKDEYSAEGKETYEENINSSQKAIIQLKGKTNELTRNVDETRSKLSDVEKSLSSEISQTAEQIKAQVTDTLKGYSTITQTSDAIKAYVKNNIEGIYATQTWTAQQIQSAVSDKVSSSTLTQTASSLETKISNKADGSAFSSLKQTVDSMYSNIYGDGGAWSKINQNASAITSKVSAGDIASTINQTAQSVTIDASKINLSGYVTASQLDVVDAKVNGKLDANALTAAKIKALIAEANTFSVGSATITNLHTSDGSIGGKSFNSSSWKTIYAYASSSSTTKTAYTVFCG